MGNASKVKLCCYIQNPTIHLHFLQKTNAVRANVASAELFHYDFISGHIFIINNLIYVLSFPGDKSDEFNQLKQVYVRVKKRQSVEKLGWLKAQFVLQLFSNSPAFPC
jgi:hypothetical protein